MNGGIISNCSAGAQTATGVGGVYVSEGATFEMNAGYIAQCSGGNESNLLSSPHAASVLNYGTFTMNSNAALWGSSGGQYVSGIALYNSGTFNANGGSIGTDSSDKQLICNDNTGTLQNSANNTTTIYSAVLNYGVISGGIFNNAVTNERDGIIENGTFKGAVSNQEGGKIKGGNFETLDGYKYSVNIKLGQNMQSSGKLTQSDLLVQDMTPVVVTADQWLLLPHRLPRKRTEWRHSYPQQCLSGHGFRYAVF